MLIGKSRMKILNRLALAEAIECRAEADLAAYNIGGASVLVAQAGQTVYKNHFGTSNPSGEAVSDSTLFRLASMTKPITAVAAMILVDRGLLSLEDTIEMFYPSFASMHVRGENGELLTTHQKITVRNLLNHTSGIGSGEVWVDAVSKMTADDIKSVDRFVEFMSTQPLSFVPGTKQEYSAVGAFSVLTGIIQKITGMTYEDFLRTEIFEPCRMRDTTFTPSEEQWSRLITMYDKIDGKLNVGKTYDGCVFEFFSTANYLGGAGLISSLADYSNFAQMLLNGGAFEGKRVISEESVAELSKPQVCKTKEQWWGLSVRVIADEAYDPLPVGNFGWSGAYGTHFWIDPSNKIIGIYMKNSRYDGGSGAITAKNFEKDVYASMECK